MARCDQAAFPAVEGLSLDFRFVTYDDIFEETDISFADTAAALWKLTKSGVSAIGRRERGVIADISDKIRWTAGYVVAWVEDEGFKRQSRKRVLDAVREHKPDVILAHSLGSLVTYNAFSHPDAKEEEVSALLAKANYVTLGSQIGNPFVIRNLTNGRILPLDVAFWYHLYNENDDVFTAPIRLWDAAELQPDGDAFRRRRHRRPCCRKLFPPSRDHRERLATDRRRGARRQGVRSRRPRQSLAARPRRAERPRRRSSSASTTTPILRRGSRAASTTSSP